MSFKDFIREMIQGMSECMDEPIQLTDEEMEKAVDEVSEDHAWDFVNEAIIEIIEEIVVNRKAMIRDMKEDEAKDEIL